MIAIPTISDHINSYGASIRGLRDENADTRRGGAYELIGGPSAILFSREAQRDDDLFQSVSFAHADGNDLTNMGLARYGIARILDTRGTGTATLARTTTGAGTIWKGTRIRLTGVYTESAVYQTTADIAVATSYSGVVVPIESVEFGPGHSAHAVGGAYVDDPLFDAFTVTSLVCTDGTALEPAEAYRARIRSERKLARKGYVSAIITACENAGASHVQPFASDFTGTRNDAGLNVVYVGDAGYNTTTALINNCILALTSVRNIGDQLQVLPMRPQRLVVDATVQLYDSPDLFDAVRLKALIRDCVLQYIGKDGSFGYKLNAMAAAIFRPIELVQGVSFAAPNADVGVTQLIGGQNNFPAVLNRYFLFATDITITLAGPQQ